MRGYEDAIIIVYPGCGVRAPEDGITLWLENQGTPIKSACGAVEIVIVASITQPTPGVILLCPHPSRNIEKEKKYSALSI